MTQMKILNYQTSEMNFGFQKWMFWVI